MADDLIKTGGIQKDAKETTDTGGMHDARHGCTGNHHPHTQVFCFLPRLMQLPLQQLGFTVLVQVTGAPGARHGGMVGSGGPPHKVPTSEMRT